MANPRHRKRQGPAAQTSNSRIGLRAWLAPLIGVTVIILLAAGASLAQATPDVFIAASLLFSLCEGVVLAFVGYAWSARGSLFAALVACLTAGLAAPGRWELAFARSGRALQPTDLLIDLVFSLAWGVLAGVAGATILRPRLAALTRDGQRLPRDRDRTQL